MVGKVGCNNYSLTMNDDSPGQTDEGSLVEWRGPELAGLPGEGIQLLGNRSEEENNHIEFFKSSHLLIFFILFHLL